MDHLDFSSLHSANFANLASSIKNAKTNKILLDNISNHYLFEEEVHMSFSILRKYEHLIRANVKKIPLKKEYHYRPEYLSSELYGTTDLWYLIMFVNYITDVNKFNMEEVYVVDDVFIDSFGKIINSERKMKESIKNPIPIYKHILKDLNKPSKQVLPSDFDKELDDLTDLKDYEDITMNYFRDDNFANYGSHVLRGKLMTDIFNLDNADEEVLVKNILSSNIGILDNYKAFGENIKIVKNGYIRPYESGDYNIKVWTDGNFQMFIDNKSVINHVGDKTDINKARTKNLFEEYSLNSDFKRRNTDFWNISQGKLIYDGKYNKNLLEVNLTVNNLNEKEIFSVDIPANKISFENEGDFIYDVEYILPEGERYHYLVQEIEIIKKDGQKVISKRQSISARESNRDFNRARIIMNKGKLLNRDIETIRLKLKYKATGSLLSETTKIHINRIKVFTIEGKTYTVSLRLDKLHLFKSIYSKSIEHSDFFNILWKKASDEYYDDIPDNVFYVDLDYKKSFSKEGSVMVECYDNNEILHNQFMMNTLKINTTKSFLNIDPSVNHLVMRFDSVNNEFKKIISINSDNNHEIKLLDMNGKVLATKPYSSNSVEVDLSNNKVQSYILDVKLKTDNININIQGKINGYLEDINRLNLEFLPKQAVKMVFEDHKVTLPKYSTDKRAYYKMLGKSTVQNDWILDMEFKLTKNNFTRKGMFGIVFDLQDSSHSYAILFRHKGCNQHLQSGLYKLAKDKDYMYLDNTFEHKFFREEMTLMKPLEIEIDKIDKKLKILKKDGMIMFCQDGNRYPFLRVEDKFAPYTDGHLGFIAFQQDDITMNATLWN
jgi:hypothetical protein